MWEINGISEQYALSKFTVAIYMYVYDSNFPVRRKHEECQELTVIYFIFSIKRMLDIDSDEVYHLWLIKSVFYKSIAVWNQLSQGESTLRPFRSLVYPLVPYRLNCIGGFFWRGGCRKRFILKNHWDNLNQT